jgi:hypothetical protein
MAPRQIHFSILAAFRSPSPVSWPTSSCQVLLLHCPDLLSVTQATSSELHHAILAASDVGLDCTTLASPRLALSRRT